MHEILQSMREVRLTVARRRKPPNRDTDSSRHRKTRKMTPKYDGISHWAIPTQ